MDRLVLLSPLLTMERAIRADDLETVKVLVLAKEIVNNQGYSTFLASQLGKYEILAFLLEQNYQITEESVEVAINGNIAVLELLLKHNAPISIQVILRVINEKLLTILTVLLKYNMPWDAKMFCDIITEQPDLATISFLHEHGCQWDSEVYNLVIVKCCVDCYLYLDKERCPPPTRLTLPISWELADELIYLHRVHPHLYHNSNYSAFHNCPICLLRVN